jgi:hypothetical protein
MRDGGSRCLRRRSTEFPPLAGTLTGGLPFRPTLCRSPHSVMSERCNTGGLSRPLDGHLHRHKSADPPPKGCRHFPNLVQPLKDSPSEPVSALTLLIDRALMSDEIGRFADTEWPGNPVRLCACVFGRNCHAPRHANRSIRGLVWRPNSLQHSCAKSSTTLAVAPFATLTGTSTQILRRRECRQDVGCDFGVHSHPRSDGAPILQPVPADDERSDFDRESQPPGVPSFADSSTCVLGRSASTMNS